MLRDGPGMVTYYLPTLSTPVEIIHTYQEARVIGVAPRREIDGQRFEKKKEVS